MRAIGITLLLSLCACGDEAARQASRAPPTPKANYTESIPGTNVTFDMVWVAFGNFWIGKTEVTWKEYELFALGEETPEGVDAVARPSRSYHPHDKGWGTGKRPACGMSRHAAQQYCVWLSKKTGKTYRLPSGDEWEWAFLGAKEAGARQPRKVKSAYAWFAKNSGGKTQPVASLQPNALGIYDLLGNVAEYTTDTTPEDENGDTWPILRGGSFADPAEKVNGTYEQPVLFEWNERDPQRPRSQWWLCDGPYTGFRVIRPVDAGS